MSTQYFANFDETLPFSDTCVQINVTNGANVTYTVPTVPAGTPPIQYSARFSYIESTNVFMGLNVTTAVPGGGLVTTQQYNEFRPGADGSQRYLKSGDVLNFATPDASAYIGISLRQLPG